MKSNDPLSITNFETYKVYQAAAGSIWFLPLLVWVLYAIISIVIGFIKTSSPLELFK